MNNQESKWVTTQRAIFFIITLILFWLGAELLLQGDVGAGAVAFGGAALATLLGYLPFVDTFEFGPGGIKAALRRAIDEAKATVEQLQSLAKATSATVVDLAFGHGRLGPAVTRREQHDFLAELARSLKEIGISEDGVAGILQRGERWILADYANHVEEAIRSTDLSERLSVVRGEVITRWINRGADDCPTFDELKSLLEQLEIAETSEAADRLRDYSYYVENKRHRRPELWFSSYGRYS